MTQPAQAVRALPPEQVSFRHTASLAAGTPYYYCVAAFNALGDSPSPTAIKAVPVLALPLDIATQLDANAKVGAHVMTTSHFLGTDYLGRDLLGANAGLGVLCP